MFFLRGISPEISVLMARKTVRIAGTAEWPQKKWEKPPSRAFSLLQLEFTPLGRF